MRPAKAPTTRIKDVPRADMQPTAARVVRVSQIEPSEFNHRGAYVDHDSLVIDFTNRAGHAGSIVEPIVKASLTYRDADREILQITGRWTDSPDALAKFKLDQPHSLLIGLLLDGQFVAVESVAPGTQ